jgi:ribonuclease VapC
LHREPGADVVERWLDDRAAISAVNLAEALSKAADGGAPPREVVAELTMRGILEQALEVHPFDRVDVVAVAELRASTRPFGLSIGDRACIALASRLDIPALTTDRAWASAPLPVDVELVR